MNKQDNSKEELNHDLNLLKKECQDIEATRKKKEAGSETLKAAFQQARDNYRAFFNAIDEFIFILDSQGNILAVNNFVLNRLGYTEDELYGKPVTMILPPDRHEEALSILESLRQGKTDFHPVPVITKSGTIIPIEARKSAGMWDGHAVLIVACKDISALKLSEEKFSKLFYLNPTASCITNLDDNTLVEVNDAFCSLLGYTHQEAVGHTAEALGICHAGTNSLIEASTNTAGQVKDLELTVINKTGSPRQVLFSSETIHIQDRKIRFVVLQDITEHKRVTEELKQAKTKAELSEEKYKQLFDNTLDHIFILEVTEEKRFKVLEVNPIQAKESGILKPGLYVEDCLDPETAERLIRNYRRCVEERTTLIYEREFYGQIFLTQLLPVRDNNGTIYRIIGIAHNITKEKALTEELVQKNETLIHLNADLLGAKKKAEESDQLKTAFLQNISHEIRTPINSIIGFANLLNEPDISAEKRGDFIDIIRNSSLQLLSIISDIISIAFIETGQEKIIESEIDLNEFMGQLYDKFQLTANAKQVALRYVPNKTVKEAIVLSDRKKLSDVLSNLLGNAFKFTKEGYVTFGYLIKNNNIEFFVEDTGIGIATDMQDEIFKRFRQVESSTSRTYGGTGLGLSISKSYIELLGGHIWLTSDIGKGSSFYFTIPYKKAIPEITQEALSMQPFEPHYPGPPKTILVAEDEDSNFLLIKELLSNTSFNILRAVNGQEAIDVCKTTPTIDIVLMDIKMPVLDGYEATRQIKAFLPNLPIIAQTAYFMESDRNKAFESGCNDFVSKPFNKNVFLSKINNYLWSA